ncbi:hypothetical protein [Plasticicumulans acidivorans]|uniref:Uncharacterized protein n=1 Tax=Plasticicumulans acidivorans TaxID=886464 RepID=A0A317MTI6_9GAMM|nr:hypothetical protein [Plasticicumulans acidivorans]PWV60653.1 hypothetical protein C7443_107228 [Plasticicumulans acidivorans]
MNAMLDIDSRSLHALSGFVRDVDLSDPLRRQRIGYDPRAYLIAHLADAAFMPCRKDDAVLLEIGSIALLLHPRSNRFWLSCGEDELRRLSLMPMEISTKMRMLHFVGAPEAFMRRHPTVHSDSIDHLLASVALRCARGRLPFDVDPQAELHLTAWPNLTRLPLTPGALRMAMLWRRQRGISIAETSVLLDLPQRHVFSFYNVCAALRLVTVVTGEPRNHAQPTSQAPKKPAANARERGLLRRLLGTLDAFLHH